MLEAPIPRYRDFSVPGAQNEDELSWRLFALAPFHKRTYACIFYFVFIGLPYNIFTFVWVVTTFLASLGLMPLFCFDILTLYLAGLSWRMLGWVEIAFVKQFLLSNRSPGYSPTVSVTPSKAGWYYSMKALLTDDFTWRAMLYFVFVKFPLSVFNFALTVGLFGLAIGGIFNIIVVYSCGLDCYGWLKNDSGDYTLKWLIAEPIGSVLTIPVGIVLYWVACTVVRKLSQLTRFFCQWALS